MSPHAGRFQEVLSPASSVAIDFREGLHKVERNTQRLVDGLTKKVDEFEADLQHARKQALQDEAHQQTKMHQVDQRLVDAEQAISRRQAHQEILEDSVTQLRADAKEQDQRWHGLHHEQKLHCENRMSHLEQELKRAQTEQGELQAQTAHLDKDLALAKTRQAELESRMNQELVQNSQMHAFEKRLQDLVADNQAQHENQQEVRLLELEKGLERLRELRDDDLSSSSQRVAQLQADVTTQEQRLSDTKEDLHSTIVQYHRLLDTRLVPVEQALAPLQSDIQHLATMQMQLETRLRPAELELPSLAQKQETLEQLMKQLKAQMEGLRANQGNTSWVERALDQMQAIVEGKLQNLEESVSHVRTQAESRCRRSEQLLDEMQTHLDQRLQDRVEAQLSPRLRGLERNATRDQAQDDRIRHLEHAMNQRQTQVDAQLQHLEGASERVRSLVDAQVRSWEDRHKEEVDDLKTSLDAKFARLSNARGDSTAHMNSVSEKQAELEGKVRQLERDMDSARQQHEVEVEGLQAQLQLVESSSKAHLQNAESSIEQQHNSYHANLQEGLSCLNEEIKSLKRWRYANELYLNSPRPTNLEAELALNSDNAWHLRPPERPPSPTLPAPSLRGVHMVPARGEEPPHSPSPAPWAADTSFERTAKAPTGTGTVPGHAAEPLANVPVFAPVPALLQRSPFR